jgi:heterogeneous nuclear ribonucleoprotein A1/A3
VLNKNKTKLYNKIIDVLVLAAKKFRAIAIFYKASNVQNLMSKRPHQIDGQEVSVYRLVPDQDMSKGKQGIKTLIVSGIKNTSLNQSDLRTYFDEFGEIESIDMNYTDNSCRIDFEE